MMTLVRSMTAAAILATAISAQAQQPAGVPPTEPPGQANHACAEALAACVQDVTGALSACLRAVDPADPAASDDRAACLDAADLGFQGCDRSCFEGANPNN
jgi:hypothetical protein